MKVGELVRCKFQPGSSGYDTKTGCMKPMLHHIKDELGLIIGKRDELSGVVYFPKFEYTHTISWRALEVISASR